MAVKDLLVRESQAPPVGAEPVRPLPAQTPQPLGPLTGREKWGYVFWGSLAAAILVTEAIAAFWSDFPVPTISGTTGRLERDHHWVKLVVLGGIVLLATRIVFYPWPYRKVDD